MTKVLFSHAASLIPWQWEMSNRFSDPPHLLTLKDPAPSASVRMQALRAHVMLGTKSFLSICRACLQILAGARRVALCQRGRNGFDVSLKESKRSWSGRSGMGNWALRMFAEPFWFARRFVSRRVQQSLYVLQSAMGLKVGRRDLQEL